MNTTYVFGHDLGMLLLGLRKLLLVEGLIGLGGLAGHGGGGGSSSSSGSGVSHGNNDPDRIDRREGTVQKGLYTRKMVVSGD